jgi:hypothetical protein
MSESQLRVVVLGPAGDAQQQLRYALDELGAQTLAVGDFNELDPVKMRELNPDVWLVSVDENTDPASLEPWQPLFDDPNDTVVFDDADVTRRLSGWDLARWARHLAAKVLGRDDLLLPPVSPDAKRLSQPGEDAESADDGEKAADTDASPTTEGGASGPFELALAEDTNTVAAGAAEQSTQVQSFDTGGLALVDEAGSAPADAEAKPDAADTRGASLETIDTGGLSLADDADLAALNASFEAGRASASAREEDPAMSLDDLLRTSQPETAATQPGEPTANAASAPTAVAASTPAATDLSGLSLMDMDADHSAPAAQPAAKKPALDLDLGGLSLTPMDEAQVAAPASKPAAKAASIGDTLGGLSLAPIDEEAESTDAKPAASVKTQELPVMRVAEGLIAVIAGLGGPDAVRQFLSALPDDLPVPVLLWQHLDAGKHDRLAQQLEKATRLPVYLARPGEAAHPGEVGVVSNGLLVAKDGGLRFAPGSGGPSQALASALNDPATVVVVLSGAEAAIVQSAKAHVAHGGKVLVQAPMTCFDATAASALDGSGAIVGMPAELATHASARWAG